MPDPTLPANADAPPAGTPAAVVPATPPATPPASDPPAGDPPALTLDDLPPAVRNTVENLRRREQDLTREVAALKPRAERLDEIETASQTDIERAQREAQEARDALTDTQDAIRTANLRVALTNQQYGLVDAETAAVLLGNEGIQFDSNHQPIGLDQAVETLVQAKSFLKGETPPPTPPTPPDINSGGGSGAQTPPTLTADELVAAEKAGKTPEEWAALKGVKNVNDFMALQRGSQ